MKTWYMLFASGEDGGGISEWSEGGYDSLVDDLVNQVGYSRWVGAMLVVEIELPEGVEPPNLVCWPINPILNGEEDEDGDQD